MLSRLRRIGANTRMGRNILRAFSAKNDAAEPTNFE